MYELIQVSEQSYYIQSPAKIGLVKLNEQDVFFFALNITELGHIAAQHIAQALTWNCNVSKCYFLGNKLCCRHITQITSLLFVLSSKFL